MTRAIKSIHLSADTNRTMQPNIALISGGGCIHVNVYKGDGSVKYVNFQLSDATFQQWADAFNLFAKSR